MNKKTIKKIKLLTRGVVRKTGVLAKKADKQTGKIAKVIQKKWKTSEPQREKYKKEFEVTAKKAGKKSAKIFKAGLKNSIKIGGDVVDVVKKDIREMRKQKRK